MNGPFRWLKAAAADVRHEIKVSHVGCFSVKRCMRATAVEDVEPEFINRIDEERIKSIAKIQLGYPEKRLV